MKRILITGENSYIGTSFKTYMQQYENEYTVDTISVRGDEWKDYDFSVYDVIYHVAGIAHIKETAENEPLYYEVNTELTKKVAEKAKKSNVKQFIFLSSMSVYGIEQGAIGRDTVPNPKSAYGKSKLLAEEYLNTISDKNFKIAIVRPPMIYGKKCPGNYKKLSNFAKKIIIFPNIKNQRSMLFIDNLSYFIKQTIEKGANGLFYPQNLEYVNTSSLVKNISYKNKKNIIMIYFPNIKLLEKIPFKIGMLYAKIFGNLYYDIPEHKIGYISLEKSIDMIEGET